MDDVNRQIRYSESGKECFVLLRIVDPPREALSVLTRCLEAWWTWHSSLQRAKHTAR